MKPGVVSFFKLLTALAVPFHINGCAELPLVVNAADAIGYAVIGAPDTEISRASIQQIPYASISAKIGSGPRSILVLGKNENGLRHWFSADNAVIVTRNGRIVQSAGFPENLKHTSSSDWKKIDRTLHSRIYGEGKQKLTIVRQLDMDLENRFGVPVKSEFETLGPREIEIAGINIKTVLVKESNYAFSINWTFSNFYWVDAYDGFIWKSTQHIARTFPPIEIEVLKPAG
jgi:hypothetical protein